MALLQIITGSALPDDANQDLKLLSEGKFEELLRQPNIGAILRAAADSSYVAELQKLAHQDVLITGIACLQSFVQINWTGPTLPITTAQLLEHHNLTQSPLGQLSAADVLAALSVDTEDAYALVQAPVFLLLARRILVDALSTLLKPSVPTIYWWATRCVSIHQKVLENRTSTLRLQLYENTDKAERELPEETKANEDAWIMFHLEKGINYHLFHENTRAMDCFKAAQAVSGMSWKLTGKLGKRLRYQTFDVAQLLVEASSNQETPINQGDEKVPTQVDLNDKEILEHINFTDDISNGGSNLRPLDQCLLLAIGMNYKREHVLDGLTKEEIFAFVTRVLEHPNNWLVHTMGLLLKSRLESDKGRTVERAALQLQALVDQYDDNDPKASVGNRLKYFYQLNIPSRWRMQRELGERFISIGALRSAQEIFERLQMWQEVIECYQHMEKKKKAEELVRERLAIEPSPKLYCILGDLLDDPQYFEKAWEISGRHYARAMRSLAAHYMNQKNIDAAIPCFERALEINPVFPRTWFALGCCFMLKEDWGRALPAFLRVVNLEPQDSETWTNIASIHLKQKRKPDAFRALKEAVKNSFDNWKIWENLLFVSIDVNELGEASQAFTRILESNPSRFDSRVFLLLIQKFCNESLVDLTNQPLSRHRKVIRELVHKVTSTIPIDPDIGRASALFSRVEGNLVAAMEATLQAYRALTKDDRYKTEEAIFIEVCDAAEEIAATALEMAEEKQLDAKTISDYVYAAKSTLRTIKSRTKEIFGEHEKQSQLDQWTEKLKAI